MSVCSLEEITSRRRRRCFGRSVQWVCLGHKRLMAKGCQNGYRSDVQLLVNRSQQSIVFGRIVEYT